MITEIDFKILDAIQQIRFPILDKIMVFITHLGDERCLCFFLKRRVSAV